MNKKLSPRVVWITVLAAIAVLAALVALAQNGKRTATNTSRATGATAPTVEVTPVTERKALSYYTGAVRGDLFTVPGAEPAKPPKPVLPITKPLPSPTPLPAVVNPFADYSYTGTVMIGSEKLGLVENTKTKEGQYLRVGQVFMGGTVTSIADNMLVINVSGDEKRLQKPDNYNLTPLDKSAPFMTAGPQPGQGGQPGQPQAGQPQPGQPQAGGPPPGGPGARRQWMQNLTPEQIQQFQQRRMNRRFDRGGQGR